jgi:putative ABC transport system substrate-binding protein
VRRREFIGLFGLLATAWPLTARGQLGAIPVVGFLGAVSLSSGRSYFDAFLQGLNEGGYVDGRNVTIESRWADGKYDRLPVLASELIQRSVAVLVGAAPPAALAAKAATTKIPVVFVSGDDPIKSGLVEKLNRPGGNVTGVSVFSGSQLGAKQIGLLHDLVPTSKAMGLLVNPRNAKQTEAQIELAQPAARALGIELRVVRASGESDLAQAFATLSEHQVSALIVGADPLFFGLRNRIIALAEQHKTPAVYVFREYAAAGGLMSYGPSLSDGYRQAGIYTARILKGERPGDMPVLLPTKFQLVINARTAKSLGLALPPGMISIADELIE